MQHEEGYDPADDSTRSRLLRCLSPLASAIVTVFPGTSRLMGSRAYSREFAPLSCLGLMCHCCCYGVIARPPVPRSSTYSFRRSLPGVVGVVHTTKPSPRKIIIMSGGESDFDCFLRWYFSSEIAYSRTKSSPSIVAPLLPRFSFLSESFGR